MEGIKKKEDFEAVIGIEVHAQLNTASKIWCACAVDPYQLENTRVCAVCSGQPGTLPVLNENVVKAGIQLATALQCKINSISYFDRKNYFYPDLPKGYQITQYHIPLAQDGVLRVAGPEGEKEVVIERIQIEEDTGKSTHEGEKSLINYNRCGTPLLEIVGGPQLSCKEEASTYIKKLHAILVYLEICRGNMQEGNLRADVNLSLRPRGSKTLGTRTQVKNLNSFRNVEKAIEVEWERQFQLLAAGKKVIQETLNFDPLTGKILSLRSKSEAQDYRYFPEPDLLPLILDPIMVEELGKSLPELPEKKAARFQREYELSEYDASVLTSKKELADYFESICDHYSGPPKKAANWVMVELLRLQNEAGIPISACPLTPKQLGELLELVQEGRISGKMAKDVFEKMFDSKRDALPVIEEMGLGQVSDEGELEACAQKILMDHPEQLTSYLDGKDKLFGFFVGQVMKATKGQANPQKLSAVLKKLLEQAKKKRS